MQIRATTVEDMMTMATHKSRWEVALKAEHQAVEAVLEAASYIDRYDLYAVSADLLDRLEEAHKAAAEAGAVFRAALAEAMAIAQ